VTQSLRIVTRYLGTTEYETTWRAMREFTDSRDQSTADELWVCEHAPVYTLGQAGRREHILNPADIPIISTDRGGQVTYHGPGQIIVYCLVNLRRAGFGVRGMVVRLENAVIELLAELGIAAQSRPEAPGVYVDGAKIAALGLRVRKGCSYHGIAFNLQPDLQPFQGIDPCGYKGLEVTSLRHLEVSFDTDPLVKRLVWFITRQIEQAGTAEHMQQELGPRV
jgi:lipoyl(octanoyl) transferase